MSAPAGEPRTAIVLLNWNRPDLTLACLDSLLPTIVDHSVSLIVCDNASSDNSLSRIGEWGRRHFGVVQVDPERAGFLLLRTPCNLGFAGGNNAALYWALRQNPGFIWVLNNDTRVFPDTLARLLETAAQTPRTGCIGATLLEADDPGRVQCAGGCRFNPWLTTYRPAYPGLSYSEVLRRAPPRLDYIAGASMFLRAGALRRVGGFNEAYFLYFEELDLARRLRRHGYELAWSRHARVIHHGGASMPQTTFSHYHENLSTLKYLWQHHRVLFPFAAAFRILAKSLYLPLTARASLYPSLVRAYRDFRPCRFRAAATPAQPVLAVR